jgi:predicted nucleic acid-binding protein
MQAIIATLDACVLFQGRLTDLLLNLAEAGGFEPVWSDAIHEEWMRNLSVRFGIPADRIAYRRGEMERAFPAANVSATPALISSIQALCKTAAQRKDAHVMATAISAKADVIVTHNIKDFATAALAKFEVSKVRPDGFCVQLLEAQTEKVLSGVRAHRASLKRAEFSPAGYLEYLAHEKSGVPKFALALEPYLSGI